jgi:DNA-binding transcriptional ArsR family regulator
VDPLEAKIFSHPLRVRIVAALLARPASARQLARAFSQVLDKVLYHLAILDDAGYAEPSEGQDPGGPDCVYQSARI